MNVIHIPHRIAGLRISQLLLLTSALSLAGVAGAALKDQPPAGLSLSGTEWQLDSRRSDDAGMEIERAEREAQSPLDTAFPDPDERPGGWSRDRGNTSTSVDPWRGTQSATILFGSRGQNLFLEHLKKNPEELTFVLAEQHVRVTADGLETECAAGAKTPISDSYGDGERSCGWNGRALVIETKRGTYFSRTDRYEMSRDGKTLKFVTTARGKAMPTVRISRTYTATTASG
jgi:hypothetical protein